MRKDVKLCTFENDGMTNVNERQRRNVSETAERKAQPRGTYVVCLPSGIKRSGKASFKNARAVIMHECIALPHWTLSFCARKRVAAAAKKKSLSDYILKARAFDIKHAFL